MLYTKPGSQSREIRFQGSAAAAADPLRRLDAITKTCSCVNVPVIPAHRPPSSVPALPPLSSGKPACRPGKRAAQRGNDRSMHRICVPLGETESSIEQIRVTVADLPRTAGKFNDSASRFRI